METVLYECTWKFDTFIVMPLMILVLLDYKLMQNQFQGSRRFIVQTVMVFAALLSLFMLVEQVDQYRKIVLAYQKGDYMIIEGYVENFHPMPDQGHGTEHFELDGIRFEYSDATVMQGYHTSRPKGGVITGDGQHLRIGYIVMNSATGNKMLNNVIVYIAELPPPQ